MSEIRIEAEDMTLTRFRVETNTVASGGRMIGLVGGGLADTGSATFTFNGLSGAYNVFVGYFDENDGVSRLEVRQNGLVVDAWDYNQNLGSALANTQTRVRGAIATALTISTGDTFRLNATENNGEPARVDYIEFVPITPLVINGTSANDRLVGDWRNNTLNGFGGNDILDGRGGNNMLNGGSGVDTADYAQAANGVIANLNTGVVLKPVFGTATPKVMPLGDSITAGQHVVDPTPGTYRIQLWENLRADNLRVDFVGSQFNGPPSLEDKNHEGRGGWTIDQIAGLVDQGTIRTYEPQMVLLMIGTNDVLRRNSLSEMYSDLSNLIDRIAQEGNTQIFVSSIAPIDAAVRGITSANLVDRFNALLPELVNDKVAQGKNVTYVNAGGSLEVADLVSDGVHPSRAGYDKIGDAWYNRLVKRDTLTGIENVIGSDFADRLRGNSGNNTLKGGVGRDTLTGGGGADNFFYRDSREGGDMITDFSANDRLTFSAADFGGGLLRGTRLSTTVADTGVFVRDTDPTPLGSSANFLYNTDTGVLRFDVDGIGASSATTIATFANTPLLNANQFYFS